jgi:hypothetical protein
VGGELRVESRVGKGSTISASVPSDEPDAADEPDPAESDSAE